MRCIALDHGEARWGVAYGDDLGVAVPLPAIVRRDADARLREFAALARERGATDIVIGHPLNMDGTAGPKAKEAEALAARIREDLGLAVHLADERLTSHEAESVVPKKMRRGVRASGEIDSRAAAIFLQEFLNQRLGLL